MATAYPTQLYEKVSEAEALSRNARQYPYYPSYPQPVPGYPVIPVPGYGQPGCEQRCQWSTFQGREICDWHCPRL